MSHDSTYYGGINPLESGISTSAAEVKVDILASATRITDEDLSRVINEISSEE